VIDATNKQRQAAFRKKKREDGLQEVRGIFAPPELHEAIKEAAKQMKQEDYNDMMRYPWEGVKQPSPPSLPRCPQCGVRYCGNGVYLCIECATTTQPDGDQGGGETNT
jgi:hypothetical protein